MLLKSTASELPVVVQFAKAPNGRTHAAVRLLGGKLVRSMPVIDAADCLPAASLTRLAAMPSVKRISSDANVRPTMDITTATVGANVAWSVFGETGKNIGIAVTDSGVASPTSMTPPANPGSYTASSSAPTRPPTIWPAMAPRRRYHRRPPHQLDRFQLHTDL